jgi:dTDP-glucose 4,6-dehydratase
MKHIIVGGDGFVGHHLASDLHKMGQSVVVADVVKSGHEIYRHVAFQKLDVTDRTHFDGLALEPDDVVYNLSAKMLSPIMPRAARYNFFYPVNYTGVVHLLDWMHRRGATRLVHFTTDMVYGHIRTVPTTEEHPTEPLGEYGMSKLETERLCRDWRERGMRISIFRPRLIIGPGRLGILLKLFRLVDLNLPVPMIGSGRNPYQFVSVFDCASAARLAWQAGVPNAEYNLGSDEPPSVRELLGKLIEEAESRSILVPTPAGLVKSVLNLLDRLNMPIMDPEQYLIANEFCVLDTTKAKQDLGWKPEHRDEDMLTAAYREYRAHRVQLNRSIVQL